MAHAETTAVENSKVWSRLKTPLCAPARAAFLVLAALIVVATPLARAEYDANGRYVPSPMGRPSDPYRSYVPGYTGKPGGTKRPSTIPQAYELKPPNIERFEAPRPRRTSTAPLSAATPTLAECKAGWSRNSGIARARFARACRALLRDPKRQQ